MAKILIPTALKQYADGQEEIDVDARTVDEALGHLTGRFPSLKKHLYTEAGALRNFVNIYLNDEDVRYLERGATKLGTGDALSIIPAIAGGAPAAPARPALVQNGHTTLDAQEIQRYSRHLLVPEIGLAGQKKLKAASVLLIGAGGLGSPLALYLAAAGVGRIGIVDFDVVDFSNLQRQVIHSTSSVGRPKLESAKERILEVNPGVQVDLYDTALSSENALAIFQPYDVVVDGTDNFPTRYLVNDACVLLGKPNVYGSIFRFEGQASVFWAAEGPCYRCLYPEPPPPGLVPSCAEGGVLGVLPGIIGVIQATETVKLLLGIGETLVGRLLLYDALKMKFREMKLQKDPACPVCGANPTVTTLIDYQEFCGIRPHTAADDAWDITATELKGRLDAGAPLFLLDVREPHEWEIGHLEGATLIPVGQVQARAGELSTADEIVVYCKAGTRSARAVQELRSLGFRKLKNLKGGINAWSEDVDPRIPKY
ncbi:MAG TPA: molybdopterin-synthase adenylyltransferase MoeB [Chloroflexia bacterium]|nr:molybdopterin-synthase adenylyltransferase MoeB [Chloroflexia bacterium]